LPKLYYASPRDLPLVTPFPGVKGRVLQTEKATLMWVDLEPKTVVDTHKHEVEQLGFVLKGSLAMIVAGEQRILTAGDSYRVPAGAAHGLRVFEEATQVLDVFTPPRDDLVYTEP
jgi:quercetin dioxygenase-like cupin family protein